MGEGERKQPAVPLGLLAARGRRSRGLVAIIIDLVNQTAAMVVVVTGCLKKQSDDHLEIVAILTVNS